MVPQGRGVYPGHTRTAEPRAEGNNRIVIRSVKNRIVNQSKLESNRYINVNKCE